MPTVQLVSYFPQPGYEYSLQDYFNTRDGTSRRSVWPSAIPFRVSGMLVKSADGRIHD